MENFLNFWQENRSLGVIEIILKNYTSALPWALCCWPRQRKFERAGLLLISESSITVARKTWGLGVGKILLTMPLPHEGHHASNILWDDQVTWRPANLRPRKAGSRFEPTHLLGGNGMRGARLGDSCWWKVQSCRWQCWSRDPCLGQTWWWWRLATFIIAGSQQFSRLQVESGNHL